MLQYFIQEFKILDSTLVEVIISNNASTDGTLAVLSKYEKKYPWLTINNNFENIGAAANMQLLFAKASGVYFWMPGDDDYLKNGLLKKLVEILINEKPNYVYLSRRNIIESSLSINPWGKKHDVFYDKLFNVNHNQLISLLYENFDDLKFQTSSVFKRELLKVYEDEFCIYNKDIKADCHSMFRSIRSIQEGKSYFMSEVSILSGDEILWGDTAFYYQFVCDPAFVEGLINFGFTKSECDKIKKRQLAAIIMYALLNGAKRKKWVQEGKPGFSFCLLPIMLKLVVRTILRKFGYSISHVYCNVEIENYLPPKAAF